MANLFLFSLKKKARLNGTVRVTKTEDPCISFQQSLRVAVLPTVRAQLYTSPEVV